MSKLMTNGHLFNDQTPNVGILCCATGWGGLEMNALKMGSKLAKSFNVFMLAKLGSRLYKESLDNDTLINCTFNKKYKYADFKAAYLLAKICKANNIEVLFIEDSKDINLASISKMLFNKQIKLIYKQNMQFGVDKKDFFHTLFYKQLDVWITPLHWLKDQVLKRTRIEPEKVKVVHYGIEIEKFKNAEVTKSGAREKLNIPQDKFIAGMIGRIDPLKGQETLIRAIGVLKEKNIIADAVLIGSVTHGEHSGYEAELKELSKSIGIEKQIHFRPYLSHVEDAFRALDVFVMATKSETYGMVTLEAIASGVPVIGTNAGGTIEILNTLQAGKLFEPGNEKDLAEKIMLYLNTTEQFTASEKIKDFDLDLQMDSIKDIIENLLKN